MTRVGWLADQSPYIGGAELTQAEFKAAAAESVEVIDCHPGGVVPGLDAYVIHNSVTYGPDDLEPLGDAPLVRYVNDMMPHGDHAFRDVVLGRATVLFTSPLHRAKFPHDFNDEGEIIPPAIDADAFRPNRQTRRNTERSGNVAIGSWQNPGKGQALLNEWAVENGPVDVYGAGPYIPQTSHLIYKGELRPHEVPQALWSYERFVHLPTALEPFGRAVVEAHLAGCQIVTNGLVGAKHFIEQDPDALLGSAERFWDVVTEAAA